MSAQRSSTIVPSVSRLLDIIEFFAQSREPATLSAIATALDLPKSSCLSILETLVLRGYLYEIAPRMGYYPTRQWLEKFSSIGEADPLRERVRVEMNRLRDFTAETIIFARRAELNVVYLDVIESSESIRFSARIGQLLPLHATASGKAILSFYSESDRSKVVRRLNFAPMTPRTVRNAEELLRDVEAGMTRGYQLTLGETVEELMGVAACAALGGEPYALVVAGPMFRLRTRVDEIGSCIKDACSRLSAQ